ncbi:hypothetical protein AVEN_102073-1 [Araneus ventricosus]|uniref:Uncharacterized protein n=1 Tax=Araneus ventricosus TaxID=182803 RepID=A0A4Y2U713_ARAVE|nr:hypothetical protein AVEN_102073-1 [Araneus ventricosus]
MAKLKRATENPVVKVSSITFMVRTITAIMMKVIMAFAENSSTDFMVNSGMVCMENSDSFNMDGGGMATATHMTRKDNMRNSNKTMIKKSSLMKNSLLKRYSFRVQKTSSNLKKSRLLKKCSFLSQKRSESIMNEIITV